MSTIQVQPVIMAGGSGTRLWPLSRAGYPKQFLVLSGDPADTRSLFQHAVERLRGLAGQVTLDLAPMPKKDRVVFEGHLRAAFRLDPVETALAGWTPLWHFELERKRERLPIPPEALP